MKRFVITLGAFLIGVGLTLGLVGKFLFDEGIVKVVEESTQHVREVYDNGELVESSTYTTKDGVRVLIDVVDEAFISY